jgi:flagellar biosynthesis protein FlhG
MKSLTAGRKPVAKGTQTICIASGKGGVGKTTFAINLSIALSDAGYSVLYFDADLGLANAQIGFRADTPYNLSHVMLGTKTLSEILIKTEYNVTLVPGASGLEQMAGLTRLQSAQIIQAFSSLPDSYDYMIIDCAAGISPSVLSFLQGSQLRLIVGTKELTSIADAYSLLKVMINDYELSNLIYVPNMVGSEREGRALFDSMNTVVQNFLYTRLHYLGSAALDKAVNLSWQKSVPAIKLAPDSAFASDMKSLAAALVADNSDLIVSSGSQFFMERI